MVFTPSVRARIWICKWDLSIHHHEEIIMENADWTGLNMDNLGTIL